MNKIKKVQRWRLNVVVTYYEPQLVNNYRTDLLELLKHLASIYRLDYAISENHPFPALTDPCDQSECKNISDLVYFRSNENSRIDQKKIRSILVCMFDTVPSMFFEGVEVFPQLYKTLPEYPFPSDFYRPLIHPYVEHHTGDRKTLCIYADEVLKVIETEQNYPLN